MASICVYCSSSERIDSRYLLLARDLGAELARRGHTLVSGGGRVSMMGAVARAARDGGAHTVGVIPQALVGLEVADEDADELIVTPDMRTRKGLMDQRSEAFIAMPGGIGTLEELLEVWTARSLAMHNKPVVVLDPDGTYDDLHALAKALQDKGFIRPEAMAALQWARTEVEAMDAVEAGLAVGAPAEAGPATPAELLESEVPGDLSAPGDP